jgi:hypothetical protein
LGGGRRCYGSRRSPWAGAGSSKLLPGCRGAGFGGARPGRGAPNGWQLRHSRLTAGVHTRSAAQHMLGSAMLAALCRTASHLIHRPPPHTPRTTHTCDALLLPPSPLSLLCCQGRPGQALPRPHHPGHRAGVLCRPAVQPPQGRAAGPGQLRHGACTGSAAALPGQQRRQGGGQRVHLQAAPQPAGGGGGGWLWGERGGGSGSACDQGLAARL